MDTDFRKLTNLRGPRDASGMDPADAFPISRIGQNFQASLSSCSPAVGLRVWSQPRLGHELTFDAGLLLKQPTLKAAYLQACFPSDPCAARRGDAITYCVIATSTSPTSALSVAAFCGFARAPRGGCVLLSSFRRRCFRKSARKLGDNRRKRRFASRAASARSRWLLLIGTSGRAIKHGDSRLHVHAFSPSPGDFLRRR